MTLDDLRKIAEAATEGPWAPWLDLDGTPHMNGLLMVGNADAVIPEGETWIEGVDINPIAHVLTPEDREFIATFDPQRVLELLARLAEHEQAVENMSTKTDDLLSKLAAVEELHEREEIDYCDDPECCDLTPSCAECLVNWPCLTIKAAHGDR